MLEHNVNAATRTRALEHARTLMPSQPGRVALCGILLLSLLPTPGLEGGENLQRFVNGLMRGRRGAVIVANPTTGELLAVWNPHTAFDQAFPPGSTAKLVISAAALEEGLLSPRDQIFCRRVPERLGEAYHCSHPQVGAPFTLTSALANSCNCFFAALSARLSSGALAHWYAVFGFGSLVSGLGSNATAGRVQINAGAVDKARAALGERTVLVTPAQLLLAYAALATRGPVLRPWRSQSGVGTSSLLLRRVRLQAKTFEILSAGLEECVRSGTGMAAAVPGVRVAGKTGTATALDGSGVAHAWFVGYAPVGEPEIALVLFLERGTGTRDAAPLAGRILKCHFSRKNRKS